MYVYPNRTLYEFFAEPEADRKSLTQKFTDSKKDNENLRAEIDRLKKALFESKSICKALNYFHTDSSIQFNFLIVLFSEKVSIKLLSD